MSPEHQGMILSVHGQMPSLHFLKRTDLSGTQGR